MDSSLPGNFSTAETPGNRVGWLRFFLGKRRGKWSVLRVGPGRSRKMLEKKKKDENPSKKCGSNEVQLPVITLQGETSKESRNPVRLLIMLKTKQVEFGYVTKYGVDDMTYFW